MAARKRSRSRQVGYFSEDFFFSYFSFSPSLFLNRPSWFFFAPVAHIYFSDFIFSVFVLHFFSILYPTPSSTGTDIFDQCVLRFLHRVLSALLGGVSLPSLIRKISVEYTHDSLKAFRHTLRVRLFLCLFLCV
jgi:fucose permease